MREARAAAFHNKTRHLFLFFFFYCCVFMSDLPREAPLVISSSGANQRCVCFTLMEGGVWSEGSAHTSECTTVLSIVNMRKYLQYCSI